MRTQFLKCRNCEALKCRNCDSRRINFPYVPFHVSNAPTITQIIMNWHQYTIWWVFWILDCLYKLVGYPEHCYCHSLFVLYKPHVYRVYLQEKARKNHLRIFDNSATETLLGTLTPSTELELCRY